MRTNKRGFRITNFENIDIGCPFGLSYISLRPIFRRFLSLSLSRFTIVKQEEV